MLTQCLVFCQLPRWENYKYKFFSIILCTVANIKEDKNAEAAQPKPAGNQTEFASGKRVLTVSKADDVQMVQPSEGFSGIGQGGEVGGVVGGEFGAGFMGHRGYSAATAIAALCLI
jgi:hypothetical protein